MDFGWRNEFSDSDASSSADGEVQYLQSQNGNLHTSDTAQVSEFLGFLEDVPGDIPWCSEALGMVKAKTQMFAVIECDL